ncbi:MAG TPA: hypothetical protein VHE10_03450 [Candidatus Paceibacterota bacterium]|nr:hypothetical protein [Candidatus Paceibacterota bacterium]
MKETCSSNGEFIALHLEDRISPVLRAGWKKRSGLDPLDRFVAEAARYGERIDSNTSYRISAILAVVSPWSLAFLFMLKDGLLPARIERAIGAVALSGSVVFGIATIVHSFKKALERRAFDSFLASDNEFLGGMRRLCEILDIDISSARLLDWESFHQKAKREIHSLALSLKVAEHRSEKEKDGSFISDCREKESDRRREYSEAFDLMSAFDVIKVSHEQGLDQVTTEEVALRTE